MNNLSETIFIIVIFIGIPIFYSWWQGKGIFDKKEKYLKEIKDELRRNRKTHEAKEGEILE